MESARWVWLQPPLPEDDPIFGGYRMKRTMAPQTTHELRMLLALVWERLKQRAGERQGELPLGKGEKRADN